MQLVQSDQLPSIICTLCIDEIKKAFKFRARIIENQKNLIDSFIESNLKSKNQESTPTTKDDVNNVEILFEIIDENYEENDIHDQNLQESSLALPNCTNCNLSKYNQLNCVYPL